MNATLNHDKANIVLTDAIEAVEDNYWIPNSRFINDISSVMAGTHLTFRYILLTGLLAKATNEECNPLALQAGSKLEGAFDARSLCHKVVVPIERKLLGSRLGGSNEPYLNKPARFSELSLDNAVRSGSDRKALSKLINVLGGIANSDEANDALKDAIYYLFKRASKDMPDSLIDNVGSTVTSSLITFAHEFTKPSIGGETCALLTGVAFELVGEVLQKSLIVKVHPINQAGSSSNEISDVDVYLNDKLIYTAEVKDKVFSRQDVEHAVSKAIVAGSDKLIFLIGPRGAMRDCTQKILATEWRNKGFNLIFIDLLQFFATQVSVVPELTAEVFFKYLDKHARDARVKDETYEQIGKAISAINLRYETVLCFRK